MISQRNVQSQRTQKCESIVASPASTTCQIKRQEFRPRNGIEDIGADRRKAQRLVQLLCRDHRRQRVQADTRVSSLARLGADALRKTAPKLFAARLWPHIESLHFASAHIEGTKRDATHRFGAAPCEQQPTAGRGIFAR